LEECEKRDPKGLYKRAKKGEVSFFTGISSPYEAPKNPNIIVETDSSSISECVQKIIREAKNKL